MSIIKGVEVPVGHYVQQPRLKFSVNLYRGDSGVDPVIIQNPQFENKDKKGEWLPLPVDYAIVGQIGSNIAFNIEYLSKKGCKYQLRTDESLIDEAFMNYADPNWENEKWFIATIDQYRNQQSKQSNIKPKRIE